MNAATLVQKLWNYCNVLRDDGMSHGDYVKQAAQFRPAHQDAAQGERARRGDAAGQRAV